MNHSVERGDSIETRRPSCLEAVHPTDTEPHQSDSRSSEVIGGLREVAQMKVVIEVCGRGKPIRDFIRKRLPRERLDRDH